jgi:uncharacterized protein YdaU (DUF1376 family)
MTPAERKAVDKVAERFFPVNGDGRRHNKRAEAEIIEAKAKSAKAKASADTRWGRANAKRMVRCFRMRTHSAGNASQSQKPEEQRHPLLRNGRPRLRRRALTARMKS